MYTIKASNVSGLIIYDQSVSNARYVAGPRMSLELNQPGEFQFLLVPGSAFYNQIQPMQTYITAEDDGEEIFYGRVLTRSDPVFKGQVTITCEGALSFLLDADMVYNRGVKDENITAVTVRQFLTDCITRYNQAIGSDNRRVLSIGNIEHEKADSTAKFKVDSYTSVQSVIQNKILDEYGGYIDITRTQNGQHQINWHQHFEAIITKPIRIGENVIDQNNRISGENIFTVIRPVGKDGLTLPNGDSREWMESDGTMRVFYGSEINEKYGKIVKPVTFSDKATDAELYAAAHDYVERLKYTLYRSSEIKLVDFHYLNPNVPKLRLGDTYSTIHGLSGITLTVSTLEVALENPGEGTVTLKNDKELESVYGGMGEGRGGTSASSSTSLSRGSSGGYGGGQKFKYIQEGEELLTLATKDIRIQADRLSMTANEVSILSREQGAMADRIEGTERIIQGSGLFENESQILAVSGMFSIDQTTGIIRVLDGADLSITKNGVTTIVGTVLDSQQTKINGLDAFKDTVQGSTIWANRDSITNFVGNFDVTTDSQGNKTIVVKDGAGLVIEKNGAQLGVYTEGDLDGGVIVQMLNDSSVTTTISGDRINLSGNSEFSTISSTVGTHNEALDNITGTITDTILGSSLWQTKDSIVNVVGEFEYVTDSHGNTSLVVKNGSAFKLRHDNAEFGIYDQQSLTGGIIINRINGSTDDSAATTEMKIQASKVNIQASDLASLGIYTESHFDAGFIASRLNDDVDGNKTLAQIIADRIEIKANQVDMSSVDFINLVNNNSGTTKINANKLDLSGTLTVDSLGTQFAAMGTAYIDNFTAQNLYVKPYSDIGGISLANAFTTGIISGNKLSLINPNSATVTFTVDGDTLTIKDTENNTLTFRKAAGSKMRGTWASGSFTVVPDQNGTDSVVTALSHLTGSNYAHWGDAGQGEDPNKYFGAIGATINGGSLAQVYSFEVNATVRYTAGQNAVTVKAITWDSNTDNTKAERVMTVSTNGRPTESTIPYTMKLENSGNDAVILKANNSQVMTIEHGKYTAGVEAGKKIISLSGWSSTTQRDIDDHEWSWAGEVVTLVANNTALHKFTINREKTYYFGVNATARYTAGWNAAANVNNSYAPTVKPSTFPVGITVKLPKTSDGTAYESTSYEYYLAWPGNNDVGLYYRTSATTGVQVANVTHGKYDAAWAKACEVSSAPTAEPTAVINATMIKLPDPDRVGYAKSYSYGLASSDDNTVGLYYTGVTPNVLVAKLVHGKYTQGHNTVSLSGWASTTAAKAQEEGWTNAGTAITLVSSNTAVHKFTVNGAKTYYFNIDASNRYTVGQQNPLKADIDLSDADFKGMQKPTSGFDDTIGAIDVRTVNGTEYAVFTVTAGNTTKKFLAAIYAASGGEATGWAEYYNAGSSYWSKSWRSDGTHGSASVASVAGLHYTTIPRSSYKNGWEVYSCIEEEYHRFASKQTMNVVLEADVDPSSSDASAYYGTMGGITSSKYYWYYTSSPLNGNYNKQVYTT